MLVRYSTTIYTGFNLVSMGKLKSCHRDLVCSLGSGALTLPFVTRCDMSFVWSHSTYSTRTGASLRSAQSPWWRAHMAGFAEYTAIVHLQALLGLLWFNYANLLVRFGFNSRRSWVLVKGIDRLSMIVLTALTSPDSVESLSSCSGWKATATCSPMRFPFALLKKSE